MMTEEKRLELVNQLMAFFEKYGISRTREGVEAWLDHWYERNKTLIDLFEKSPNYNGNYQIVVPVEWAREIDTYGIHNFANWLTSIKKYGLEKAYLHSFSYKELNDMRSNIEEMISIMSTYHVDVLNGQHIRDLAVDHARYNTYVKEFRNRGYHGEFVQYDNELYWKSSMKFDQSVMDNMIYYLQTHRISSQFLTENDAARLNGFAGKSKARNGQKLSRAVRNIAVKYGWNTHPDWEREFAKFADAVNPLDAKKWTVISIHPIDFLTISHGTSWSSCATTDPANINGIGQGDSRSSVTDYVDSGYRFSGSHMSICSSFAFDKTSFVFYTINERYSPEHPEMYLKETRQMFHFNGTTLVQNRLYPQKNDDSPVAEKTYTKIREIVQRLLSECTGEPNLWTVKRGHENVCAFTYTTGSGYSDFTDPRNKQCTISYTGQQPSTVYIGANGMCPYCGCIHEYQASINCRDCDPRRY